jgi:DoxX-like family
MNTGLWIVQIVLALVFLIAGGLKLVVPVAAARLGREHGLSPRAMRVIGLLEVLGAVGVVLPARTGILPWVTPLAAAGLTLTMIGAAIENKRLKHHSMIPVNVLLGLLAIFVVYGRSHA